MSENVTMYSPPSVLAGDWLQDPLPIPKTTDAQVLYIKWYSSTNTVTSSYPRVSILQIRKVDCKCFPVNKGWQEECWIQPRVKKTENWGWKGEMLARVEEWLRGRWKYGSMINKNVIWSPHLFYPSSLKVLLKYINFLWDINPLK